MKIITKKFCIAILLLPLAACSTVEKGTFLGAGIGGGAGLAVSSQDGRTNGQRMTGLAVGALIGGTIGYLASKEKIKKEQMTRVEPGKPEFIPRIKRPEVRRVWVPDQIVGDEYVQGHWKFLIDQPAVWTKEN